MNEDLKWLATNVHEWPGRRTYAVVGHCANGHKVFWDCGSSFGETFNEAQWQSARDELSGKPSWDEAPEWAHWLAQDYDGWWLWYENKPERNEDMWLDSDIWEPGDIGPILGDWRNTLERRPAAEQTEWRGPEDGLPPIGVECEYLNHITQTVDHCIVLAEHDGGVVVAVHEDDLPYSYHYCAIPNQFRPIRTEEDKAVEEMIVIWKRENPMLGDTMQEQYARQLYRAGLRFTEQGKSK